jgi:hypothetical protein
VCESILGFLYHIIGVSGVENLLVFEDTVSIAEAVLQEAAANLVAFRALKALLAF